MPVQRSFSMSPVRCGSICSRAASCGFNANASHRSLIRCFPFYTHDTVPYSSTSMSRRAEGMRAL